MNAIRILLDDMAGQAWPDPSNLFEPYLLQIDDDVVIGLHEDSDGSYIHLCSRPGYLRPAGWQGEQAIDGAWLTTTHDEDTEPGVMRTLRIEPHDGRVLLLESWPRALLDKVRLSERLAYFTELTRWWKHILVQTPLASTDILSCESSMLPLQVLTERW